MFLYTTPLPEQPTFAPSFDDMVAGKQRGDRAMSWLWDASRELNLYRDNTDAEANARSEAYERRNRAIFEASGVQLENPYRLDFRAALGEAAMREQRRMADPMAEPEDPAVMLHQAEAEWRRRAAELARQQPQFAGVIGLDRDIGEDAFAIARGAEEDYERANAEADAAGVGTVRKMFNTIGGGFAGMIRDPMQVAALFAGGTISAPARTVFGRVVQSVLTEGAVNAGVEAGVQLAAEDWRRRAGTEHGLAPALEQVGLAALFGGGLGGLLQGGKEVFRLAGKAVPEEAFARIGEGRAEPGDVQAIADALGVQLDADMSRAAALAVEQAVDDAAAFGPPPAGTVNPEGLAAEAIRGIEAERAGQVDRIVRSDFPLGAEPKRPVSLMQFLASRDVGGIKDDGGELAAMGLTRKFVPGGGALVRGKGKNLDMAREAAAEAGYFDNLYGDPDRATAQSTVDDLLRALRAEAGGEPVYSPRNDGGRLYDWQAFEGRRRDQATYRRVVDDVSGAIGDLGIEHQLDDAVIRRAVQLVDDETDATAALERALDEDYRSYADALTERGEDAADETDIPFFGQEDTGAMPDAGRPAGQPRGDGEAGGRGDDAPDGERLSRAGADEAAPGLRQLGDTPEPASPEAGEIAALALTEATPAGEQALLPGVKPVSTKQRLETEGAKPMRGGDAAMPEGGLFDLEAQKQIDIWDAMPAAKTADGQVLSATHATMTADADRAGLFSDLISSCKD